jgi:hypothetical protein
MKKTLYIFIGALIFLGIVLVYTSIYLEKYSINATEADIEKAIEERFDMDIVVRAYVATNDKLHFVFTIGDRNVGSGELVRGWNKKYKVEFYGHGTNWIRQRIVETNEGQYLKPAGRNNKNIGSIKAFVGDEVYDVAIPDGDYYIVMTPVRDTELEFTSGMIVYDREGKELERINLPVGNS